MQIETIFWAAIAIAILYLMYALSTVRVRLDVSAGVRNYFIRNGLTNHQYIEMQTGVYSQGAIKLPVDTKVLDRIYKDFTGVNTSKTRRYLYWRI